MGRIVQESEHGRLAGRGAAWERQRTAGEGRRERELAGGERKGWNIRYSHDHMVRRPPDEGKSPTFAFLIPPQCQSKTIRPSRLRLHPRLLRHHLVLPPRPSSFVRSSPSAVHPLPTFTLVSTIVKSPLLADDMLLLLWPLMAFIFLAEAARGCYDGWPTAPRQSCSSTPFPRITPTLQCRGLATAPRLTMHRRR